MKLNEFIKTNKISKDTFIAVYNKNKTWIICGLTDDIRLVDYMDYTVLDSADVSSSIVRVTLDYDLNMQLGYYKMKAEQIEARSFSGRDGSTSEVKQHRSRKRPK